MRSIIKIITQNRSDTLWHKFSHLWMISLCAREASTSSTQRMAPQRLSKNKTKMTQTHTKKAQQLHEHSHTPREYWRTKKNNNGKRDSSIRALMAYADTFSRHTCTLCPCTLPFKIVVYLVFIHQRQHHVARLVARAHVALSFMPGDREFKISKKVYRTYARFARCAAAAGFAVAANRFYKKNIILTLRRAAFTCEEKMHSKGDRHDVSVVLFFIFRPSPSALFLSLPFSFKSKVFHIVFFLYFLGWCFFGGSFCADWI